MKPLRIARGVRTAPRPTWAPLCLVDSGGQRVIRLAALLAWTALLPQAAIAWEDAPEVTPVCQMNCDEPVPLEDSSDSTDSSASSSGGSSFEVNYDSAAYHFGQRVRQAIGLPSMYDLQESTPAVGVGRQQWRTALDYNQQGLNYYQQRDWQNAITAFRQALEYADHPTIQANLRAAVASDYDRQGLDYANQGDWPRAIAAFRQALESAPDAEIVQQHLRDAEAKLAETEAAQRLQESRLADTRTKVHGILDNLAASLETSSASTSALPFQETGVDFDGRAGGEMPSAGWDAMHAGQPDGPFIDASVVDLRDAQTLVVDPAKVRGDPPGALEFMGADDLRDVHILGPPATAIAPSTMPAALASSRKVGILLDALDHGHGNWETSFQYLQDQLADAPDDPAVRGALADALYAYYLDVGAGGTPEGNPLGRAREPEPTTREIIRDLERLGFGEEEARGYAAQLKADSAELALSAPPEAQDAAEDETAPPQRGAVAQASLNTAVYLAATLAAQGETDASLLILTAVRQATPDDPDRQAQLDFVIAGLKSMKRDADAGRAP